MKKLLLVFLGFVLLFTVGCGSNGEETLVAGELSDLMVKVYEGIPDDQKPMMLMDVEVTEENVESFLGSASIKYEKALASESAVGSIAHSVVLVRAQKGQDVEKLKNDIKTNVNPRKWVCVGVEEDKVIVDNIGDLVILIMSNDHAETIHQNFKNLKSE